MGARRIRRQQVQHDQRLSRRVNGLVKSKERERRQDRLVQKLKEGQFQNSPTVQSWLSAEIGKPARYIKQEDVDRYLAKVGAR